MAREAWLDALTTAKGLLLSQVRLGKRVFKPGRYLVSSEGELRYGNPDRNRISEGSPPLIDLGSEPAWSGVRIFPLGCQRLSGPCELAQSG